MSVTDAHIALASRLRAWMNRVFVQKQDGVVYGVPEHWTMPKEVDGRLVGDCEDHAIYAFAKLVEQGFPKDGLQLAICRTASGEGHCILLLATPAGGYLAFDNLHPTLIEPRRLGYTDWLVQQRGRPITEAWIRWSI